MKKSLWIALVFVACFVSLTFAMGGGGGGSQKTYCGFEGRITDQDGNTLKDVEIVLIPVESNNVRQAKASDDDNKKNLSAVTGPNGRYKFVAVRPGVYRVRYSVAGYQTLEKHIEFKRGTRDAVFNIELRQIIAQAEASGKK